MIDVIMKGVGRESLWDIMYYDDVVIIGKLNQEVKRKTEEFKIALEK